MQKKIVKKALSYLLTAVIIVGSISLSPLGIVEAKANVEVKNVNLNVGNSIAGTINPTVGGDGYNWVGSKVYYNNVLYRVLDKNGLLHGHSSKEDYLLLFAEDSGVEICFDQYGENCNWSTSTIRTYLNGTGPNQFLEGFTEKEREAIDTTRIEVSNTDRRSGVSGTDTFPTGSDDQIFLLDLGDVGNEYYGFVNNTGSSYTRKATHDWHLRSPGDSDTRAAYVQSNGKTTGNNDVSYDSVYIRPAFNLNLSFIRFSLAGGVSKSSFDTVADDAVSANQWKLT